MKIILAAVVALTTAVTIYFWLDKVKQDQTSFKVYRTKIDFKAAKTRLFQDNLEIVSLPDRFRASLSKSLIPASTSSEAAYRGRFLSRDVPKGSLLLFEHLQDDETGDLSVKLKKGRRAVTIPVSAPSTVGYFVEPGSLVDVLGTLIEPLAAGEQGAGRSIKLVTKTLLQSVRVLAVGSARSLAEYNQTARSGYSTVTVEVSPLEAEQIVFALQQVRGGLTLVLRNSEDDVLVETPSVDWKTWGSGAGNVSQK